MSPKLQSQLFSVPRLLRSRQTGGSGDENVFLLPRPPGEKKQISLGTNISHLNKNSGTQFLSFLASHRRWRLLVMGSCRTILNWKYKTRLHLIMEIAFGFVSIRFQFQQFPFSSFLISVQYTIVRDAIAVPFLFINLRYIYSRINSFVFFP